MKKNILVIITFLIIIIVAGFLVERINKQNNFIKINEKKIRVEIMQTDVDRARGLSGRENLCADCGMLFVFGKAENYPFWMKEMKFELDMLWIMGDKVVKIKENIPYQKGEGEVVDPGTMANKVLEIQAGKSEEWGIKEGDRIDFNLK